MSVGIQRRRARKKMRRRQRARAAALLLSGCDCTNCCWMGYHWGGLDAGGVRHRACFRKKLDPDIHGRISLPAPDDGVCEHWGSA